MLKRYDHSCMFEYAHVWSCIGLIVGFNGRLWCGRGTQSWRNYMENWPTLIGTCSDDWKSFPLFQERRFLVRSMKMLRHDANICGNFATLFLFRFICCKSASLYSSTSPPLSLFFLLSFFVRVSRSHRAFWWGCDWREEESSRGHAALHYKHSCSVQQPSAQRFLQGKTNIFQSY